MKKTGALLMLATGLFIFNDGHAQGNSGSNVGVNNQGQGQGVTRWKLDGNTGTGNEFIGTTNQSDLILKSGNETGLIINPDRDIKIPGQIYIDLHRPTDPGGENIMVVDYNGKVTSMDKSGFTQVIASEMYSEPCKYLIDGSSGSTYTVPAPTWASITGINQPGVIWTGAPCAPARVGIGTDSPDASLHVVGTGHFENTVGIGAPDDNNNRLTIVQSAPNRNGLVVNTSSTSTSTFTGIGIQSIVNNPNRIALAVTDENSGHDMLKIMGNGNIEITGQGTNDKSITISNNSNQDVFRVMGNGYVYATKIRVSLPNEFPDYVFQDAYELLTIEELEKFITSNNHLPNMPTACEIESEGMDIGELNRILVEKVEELTLYIIDLNKQIEILQSK